MLLTIWRWVKNPNKYLASTGEIFKNSPTFRTEWYPDVSINVSSPLERPIPDGYEVFVAVKNQSFPYDTSSIQVVKNIFTSRVIGTYFIANASDIFKMNMLLNSPSL